MKQLEDFYGKFILRDGDLLPEEINEALISTSHYTKEFLNNLLDRGLVFDNQKRSIEKEKQIVQ